MLSCSCTFANATDKSPPDPALLEFLADSVQVGKDRVDPLSMQSTQDESARHDTKRATGKSGQSDTTGGTDNKHRHSAHE